MKELSSDEIRWIRLVLTFRFVLSPVMRLLLLLSLLTTFSSTSAARSQQLPLGTDAPVLGPGDVVRITVWRNKELSGEFEVAADSSIRHPLYRQVRVAGIPLPSAEARIRSFLERFEANPEFVIEPLFRVAVGGEVRQPDLYAFRPEVTLVQAVALAGGPTADGRLDRVRLIRSGGGETVLDLTRPETGVGQVPIRSGDQIVVERRQRLFRDFIAPAASVAAALAAVLGLLLR